MSILDDIFYAFKKNKSKVQVYSREQVDKLFKDNKITKTSELENDSNFATTSDLPTKTSELENDSNFATTDDLAEKQDTLTAGDNIAIDETGKISAKNNVVFEELVSVEHLCLESTTIGPGATNSDTKVFSKEGYYPICLAGFEVVGTSLQKIKITSASLGSVSVNYALRNGDAGANTIGSLKCNILWGK